MKHSIKIVGTIAVMTLATSHFTFAQSDARERSAAASDARQVAGERVKKATSTEARDPAGTDSEPREKAMRAPEAGRPTADGRDRGAEQASGARVPQGQQQGQAQREAAMERQQAQRADVHDRRMARLNRLRDLAVENDREETVARVDTLIERERERHSKQNQQIQERTTRPGLPESTEPK